MAKWYAFELRINTARQFLVIALGVIALAPAVAWADCLNPSGGEGELIYNGDQNVPQICDGTHWIALGILNPAAGGGGCSDPTGVEGQVIYNGEVHKPQYCDGDDWREMIGVLDAPSSCADGDTIVLTSSGWDCTAPNGGGLTGPSGCANIGDLCADGTVFAGWHPVTQDPLFIPPTDQGTTSKWKIWAGTDDIATDSTYDGRANQNQISGLGSGTFPAFDLCYNLTFGGHSDWYLPSQVELYYLWAVSPTIQAAGHITNFQSTLYWSSTEYLTTNAWDQRFANGSQNFNDEDTAYRVRCVRR